MTDAIVKTLVTFFAVYGLMGFVREIIDFFFSPKRVYEDLVVVVKVLNSQDTLEATVRMILWKCLSHSHGSFTPNILIVDLGSSDDTPQIAKRLCNDYSFIEYTTNELYLKSKNIQKE